MWGMLVSEVPNGLRMGVLGALLLPFLLMKLGSQV